MLKRRGAILSTLLLLALGAIWFSEWAARSRETAASNVLPEQAAALAVNSLTPAEEGCKLSNPRHEAYFTPQGLRIIPQAGPAWEWQLTYVGIGDGAPLAAVDTGQVSPITTAPDVVAFSRGGLTEQYLARVDSLEQQFVIPQPLALRGADLVIVGAVSTEGTFETVPQGWLWCDPSGVVSLGGVHVFDAAGRELPAALHVTATQTRLWVDGAALASAAYPVTIDPEIGTNDFRISNMGPDGDESFDAFGPAVAYNSTNNEYLVVWAGDDVSGSLVDGEIEIYGQRIDAETGAEVGADFRISDMGTDGDTAFAAQRPAVAYNGTNNEYVVVWQGDDDSLVDNDVEIYGQRIDAETGAEVGTDFRISDMGTDGDEDFDAFNPAVAYNSTDNEYLVVWQGDDDTGSLVDNEVEIYGQRIDAETGAEVGADFRISDMGATDGDTAYRAQHPAVAYNSTDNKYLVVWAGDDDSAPLVDDEFEIFGQRIDAETGAEVGADFRLSDMGTTDGDTALGAYRPAVAYNSTDNEYLVAWMGDDDGGSLADGEYEIFGQRIDAETGTEVGADFRISDMGATDGSTAYAAFGPWVAYGHTSNEYLVVWRGDDDTDPLVNDELEIYVQRIDASTGGETGDNDLRISDMGNTDGDTTYNADNPAMAYNSTEHTFIVVWQGDDEIGTLVDDEVEVLGQRFVSDGDDDGITDDQDNCPNHDNEDQANLDGDGLGNVCDDTANDRPTSTGSGVATLQTSAGYFSFAAGVGNPCPNPPDLIFPHGWFSFTIEGLLSGIEATITITLPDTMPTDTQYWKCGPTAANPADHWYQIPMGDNDGDNVIIIAITDGGDGDDNLAADGTITDPGGPGQPPVVPPVPVGGIIIPVNKLELLAPWMGLVALASLAALTVVLARRRRA